MVAWGGVQDIPFCRSCYARLNNVSSAPFCAFDEADPDVLRPTARPAAIPEQVDRPEEAARSGNLFRRAWDWLMEEEE